MEKLYDFVQSLVKEELKLDEEEKKKYKVTLSDDNKKELKEKVEHLIEFEVKKRVTKKTEEINTEMKEMGKRIAKLKTKLLKKK